MKLFRRWELRSIDLGSGFTAHVSWHTTERAVRRAALYWTTRAYENDGAREDSGIRYYIRQPEV